MDIDERIVELLSGRHPGQARDLILLWSELRHSSWADAARESELKAGSGLHTAQMRGQLRHHLGEAALAEASRKAGVGALPFSTTPAGGVFIISRVGRFGLVSLTAQKDRMLPRRSITRKMLSHPNEVIDPQARLFPDETPEKSVVMDLAYFGCLMAVPNMRDPSVPGELALGVPNAGLTHWLSWVPLHRLISNLQERVDGTEHKTSTASDIADSAFPKFRLPVEVQNAGPDGK